MGNIFVFRNALIRAEHDAARADTSSAERIRAFRNGFLEGTRDLHDLRFLE